MQNQQNYKSLCRISVLAWNQLDKSHRAGLKVVFGLFRWLVFVRRSCFARSNLIHLEPKITKTRCLGGLYTVALLYQHPLTPEAGQEKHFIKKKLFWEKEKIKTFAGFSDSIMQSFVILFCSLLVYRKNL